MQRVLSASEGFADGSRWLSPSDATGIRIATRSVLHPEGMPAAPRAFPAATPAGVEYRSGALDVTGGVAGAQPPATLLNPFGMSVALRLVALVFSLLAPLSLFAQDSPKRNITDDIGIDQRLGEQVPLDLEFLDEAGKSVKLRDFLSDKPVILTCVYYRCPMLCTQVLNGVLKSAQGLTLELDEDYTVLSVSIDPRETPAMAREKKKTYIRQYRRDGAEEGWRFLTGKAEAIEQLTKAVGFRYRYDAASDQFAHASGIVVLTPDGKISRYFYGIDYHPRDLRLGLVESSKKKIGSPVDQVLLLCFHYDPVTGRYGMAIATVLRLAGIATLVVMAVFLFRMFLLERRRSRADGQRPEGQRPEAPSPMAPG
jgi:protein SCO1/2